MKKSETKNNESRISGAIFDEGHDSQETAFIHAVDRINLDRSLLVRTRLIAHIERIPRGDSFKATKKGILKNDLPLLDQKSILDQKSQKSIFGSKIHFRSKSILD